MSGWNPGDLRALAAYIVFEEGTWVAEPRIPLTEEDAASTIRTVAENCFGDEQGQSKPLTDADLTTVREHVADAVVMIDGVPYGADL